MGRRIARDCARAILSMFRPVLMPHERRDALAEVYAKVKHALAGALAVRSRKFRKQLAPSAN